MLKPIDLQTLFTHLQNVGKSQSAAMQSIQAQQAVQGQEIAKKSELEETVVDKNNEIEEEESSINPDGGNKKPRGAQLRKRKEDQGKKESFKDPDLGSHIDLEG